MTRLSGHMFARAWLPATLAAGAAVVLLACRAERRRRCARRAASPQAAVLALIGNTPLIELRCLSCATGCRILGKAEFLNPGGSNKDRIALAIIREAEARQPCRTTRSAISSAHAPVRTRCVRRRGHSVRKQSAPLLAGEWSAAPRRHDRRGHRGEHGRQSRAALARARSAPPFAALCTMLSESSLPAQTSAQNRNRAL